MHPRLRSGLAVTSCISGAGRKAGPASVAGAWQGLPGQGLPGQGLPGQGLPGQGLPGQGLPGQGLPGQGLPGQGLPGQGLPGQGLRGRGWGRQGAHCGCRRAPRPRGTPPATQPPRPQPRPGPSRPAPWSPPPRRLRAGTCSVLEHAQGCALRSERRQTAVGQGRGSAGSHAAAHWPCHCLFEGRGSPGAPTQSQGCTGSHASRLPLPQT